MILDNGGGVSTEWKDLLVVAWLGCNGSCYSCSCCRADQRLQHHVGES